MNTGCVYLIGAGCGPAGFGPLGLWLVAGRRGFGRAAGLAFRRFAGGGCAGYAVAFPAFRRWRVQLVSGMALVSDIQAVQCGIFVNEVCRIEYCLLSMQSGE